MPKNRLEAFSDGVIAIIITIMVLELRIPDEPTRAAIADLWPVLFTYVLSFVNIGIYWNNHHHLLHSVRHVTGGMLWANLHLLFWLSLFPFFTGWMGENHFDPLPTAAYGAVCVAAAVAYFILQRVIVADHGRDSALAVALGRDLKGKASPLIYAVAIPLAALNRWISIACYVAVALVWLVPDRRIEHALGD